MGRLEDLQPDYMAMTHEERLEAVRKIRAERRVRQPNPAKEKKAAAGKAKATSNLVDALKGLSEEELKLLLGL
jgi:hypothetical protein